MRAGIEEKFKNSCRQITLMLFQLQGTSQQQFSFLYWNFFPHKMLTGVSYFK